MGSARTATSSRWIDQPSTGGLRKKKTWLRTQQRTAWLAVRVHVHTTTTKKSGVGKGGGTRYLNVPGPPQK